MSNARKQLESVFQEVTDLFANNPHITVSPEEGDPPERYRVTYLIQGVCKNEDGEVHPCDKHVISISLPFGFPHFPPNCHPETPTFHPDFDSSAICIGDVWEADKSISKIILHIGQMISGQIYSLTNAFNEEAADWYKDNTDQLPFDRSLTDQQASAPPSLAPAKQKKKTSAGEGVDTLGDDDFSQSFTLERDEEEKEEEEFLDSSPSPLSGTIDIDRLRTIVKQKYFHSLSKELQSIDTHFDGREDMEHQTQEAMDKARLLFREGDDLEHQGEQQKAMQKYRAVAELVSDYPQLLEAQERVQQSLDLLGDWVTGETQDIEEEELDSPLDSGAAPFQEISESVESSLSSAPETPEAERTFYEEEKTAGGRKGMTYAIGGGCLALLATLIISYFSLSSGLEDAEQSFSDCKALLDADKFNDAEEKCRKGLDLLAGVQIVKQKEKDQLTSEIHSLLASDKLRQGLAGNTLVDGQFVSASAKLMIQAFKEAKKNGDTFFQQENWQEALRSYEKALKLVTKDAAIDSTLLVEVNKQLSRARYNFFLEAGEKAFAASDWKGASVELGKALKSAKADPNIRQEDIVHLEALSNQADFHNLQTQGQDFFSKSKWTSALKSYQQALKFAKELKLADSDTLSELQENIARTNIYMTVEKGKEAFAAAQWDKSITFYEQAILLLEENSKLLNKIDTDDSRKKLSRIMLHASVIRDKQDVAKLLKANDYESALATLQHMKKTIADSSFSKQPEFQATLKEIPGQVKETKEQKLIAEKSAFLMEKYEKLFHKHYPASKRSILSSPLVEFLEKIDGNLLFKMQCTEQDGGGRPLRLQMNYLFSPANGQWQLYSEE